MPLRAAGASSGDVQRAGAGGQELFSFTNIMPPSLLWTAGEHNSQSYVFGTQVFPGSHHAPTSFGLFANSVLQAPASLSGFPGPSGASRGAADAPIGHAGLLPSVAALAPEASESSRYGALGWRTPWDASWYGPGYATAAPAGPAPGGVLADMPVRQLPPPAAAAESVDPPSTAKRRPPTKTPARKRRGDVQGERGDMGAARAVGPTAAAEGSVKSPDPATGLNVGVWTAEEVNHFYDALQKFGRNFPAIASVLRTRSASQVTGLFHRCLRRAIDPVKRAAAARPDVAHIAESLHLFERLLPPQLQIRVLFAAREIDPRMPSSDDKDADSTDAKERMALGAASKWATLTDAIHWSVALLQRLLPEVQLSAETPRPPSDNVECGAEATASRRSHDEPGTCAEPAERVRPPTGKLVDAALTRQRREICLQIVPQLDAPEETVLVQHERNPRILLTLRASKRLGAVFDYLVGRWEDCMAQSLAGAASEGGAAQVRDRLRLRVVPPPHGTTPEWSIADRASGAETRVQLSQWWSRAQHGDGIVMDDVHRACGCPEYLRVEYAWLGQRRKDSPAGAAAAATDATSSSSADRPIAGSGPHVRPEPPSRRDTKKSAEASGTHAALPRERPSRNRVCAMPATDQVGAVATAVSEPAPLLAPADSLLGMLMSGPQGRSAVGQRENASGAAAVSPPSPPRRGPPPQDECGGDPNSRDDSAAWVFQLMNATSAGGDSAQ